MPAELAMAGGAMRLYSYNAVAGKMLWYNKTHRPIGPSKDRRKQFRRVYVISTTKAMNDHFGVIISHFLNIIHGGFSSNLNC